MISRDEKNQNIHVWFHASISTFLLVYRPQDVVGSNVGNLLYYILTIFDLLTLLLKSGRGSAKKAQLFLSGEQWIKKHQP